MLIDFPFQSPPVGLPAGEFLFPYFLTKPLTSNREGDIYLSMNAVKIHRIQKDMTGIELADAVGVDPGYISQVERYDTMSEHYAKLVAKALRVKLLDIFEPAEREGRYRSKNVKVTVGK